MKKMLMLVMILSGIICSCSHDITVEEYKSISPVVFPDYKDVVIPSNVAPMNFVVEAPAGKMVLKLEHGGEVDYLAVKDGEVSFGKRFWNSLMEKSRGGRITFTLCVKEDGKWIGYEPFTMTVAEEDMDPYLAYRLIPPGYTMWKEMSICQRNLENYKESRIYSNLQGRGNCVNCHSFRDRDPDYMLFHLRSELGGTYIFRNGVKEKLDTKTDNTISPLVYPYWHTTGNYVAFTVNTTNEVVHTKNINVVEVVDEVSDVVVYDVNAHEIVTADVLSSDDSFETFPTFSPDGRSLYFCSAASVAPMPAKFRGAKYSLCRVDFNPEDCSFGTQVDTLYNARIEDRSVSFPRISPDGRFLVFALSNYGNFSIWHKDSDLYSVDLTTGEVSPMTALNSDDVESYHSWSSNSRWLVFSSRRDDGLYTKPYFSYIDREGNAHKPFLLPQKSPRRYYDSQMYAYNIPEFVSGKVGVNGSEIAEFAREGKAMKLGYRRK
ncbi:MAG: PD40 domain-containing protein [Bacteroidales bacterium]|nr:PD40 domain-containing protein [Bacteroidales bacterium]